MNLKQINQEKRIIFLKLFTEELIKNTIKAELKKNTIKAEKIKQKYLEPNLSSDEAIKKIIKNPAFQESKYNIQELPIEKRKIPKRILLRKPMIQRIKIPKNNLSKNFLKRIKKNQIREISSNEINIMQTIKPQYQSLPSNFNLGKIELFLKDPFIQSIECRGPGQSILIKRQNRITPTRIILTSEEIKEIINNFSQKAKIPIIEGILKAAVGNLVISAVTSEFVGSRFIINKISPK